MAPAFVAAPTLVSRPFPTTATLASRLAPPVTPGSLHGPCVVITRPRLPRPVVPSAPPSRCAPRASAGPPPPSADGDAPSYDGWQDAAYETPSTGCPANDASAPPDPATPPASPTYGGYEEPAYGAPPAGGSSSEAASGASPAAAVPVYDGFEDPVYNTPATGATGGGGGREEVGVPKGGTASVPTYGGWQQPAYTSVPPGGDDGGVPYSGGGGGGGDEDGDGGGGPEEQDGELAAVLKRQKASLKDVPEDILAAYRNGFVGVEAVANFFAAKANVLSRFLMGCGPGMRNRFLADKLFLLKILIEEGIGVFGKLSAEYEQRRSDFWKQGEFVFANLITAILADFALVYLPAPSVALTRVSGQKGFAAWLANLSTTLPSNVFQTDRAFTVGQRAGGFALKASQLFAVGTMCCFVGAALTNALVYIREQVDENYRPKTVKPNVVKVSLLYATFLGLSSGSRYQLVNGVENHIFPRIFKSTPRLVEEAATFVLRYGNTFWGSQQWVMFCRYTNVQKTKEE